MDSDSIMGDICFELIVPSIHPSLCLGPFPACTELGAPPVDAMELVKFFHGISVKKSRQPDAEARPCMGGQCAESDMAIISGTDCIA